MSRKDLQCRIISIRRHAYASLRTHVTSEGVGVFASAHVNDVFVPCAHVSLQAVPVVR